ncbi:MAG: 23S rRNA (guanosine(2251)-2'-O)-methyltransferase RlmB [Cytophagaceae bacterium]|nr:23S rRNA (guanosine(2251)-2'-O)-methyltransferase RlmB [Cytophagaceae bacterium]
MIFGIRPVIESIEAGKEIERIYIQRDAEHQTVQELLQLTATHQLPVVKVPTEKLNRLTRKNHQGVVAFISPISYASLDNIVSRTFESGKSPLLLILDRITDVRNIGAIARTAECMGAQAIVVPSKGSAPISADAVKTSAGALYHLPVCRVDNLKQTVRYLKESGIQIIACSEKGSKTIFESDYTLPTAIIMGSEEDGIASELITQADDFVLIPMTGTVQSLNVSVATGMILSEAVRQRGKK